MMHHPTPALAIALAASILFSACDRRPPPPPPPPASTQPAPTAQVQPAEYVPTKAEVSRQYQDATMARLDATYAVVMLAEGDKTMVPLASLTKADRAWLTQLAQTHPLAKGKSSVVVVASTAPAKTAKQTILVAKTEGTLETVQLCPPSIIRNQLGGTCMIYARVHWLDIAGYYVEAGTIYKIINHAPPNRPWVAPHYVAGLNSIMTGFKPKPIRHRLPTQAVPFEWARQELRHGRPLLAAFPREIWQALPPGFVAEHPWNGGSVGHQIIINGFTWDTATQKGTFHIINSWQELMEFDLTTDAASGGALVIEESLSPLGEAQAAAVKEVIQKITRLKAVGSASLYEVQSNLGTRRIVAASEAKARSMVEEAE